MRCRRGDEMQKRLTEHKRRGKADGLAPGARKHISSAEAFRQHSHWIKVLWMM